MHDRFIQRCLDLATRGRTHTGINPLVGAVLVRGEEIVAEGWHRGLGLDHAEKDLLGSFDKSIKDTDILYVNLEPCCHHGKTPPCTEAILESGIKHVVIGMVDPNPEVSGQGIENLRSKGVEVSGPVLRAQCEHLNRGYCSVIRSKRPWITLKKAQTRDGFYAAEDGSPIKITSEDQDVWSHTYLRATHDAILVGVGTILSDDPLLDIRKAVVEHDLSEHWKIILDPKRRIPEEFAAKGDRTLVIQDLPTKDGQFIWEDLWKFLLTPRDGFPGVTSILVEGGLRTWEIFEQAGVVDEEVILTGVR